MTTDEALTKQVNDILQDENVNRQVRIDTVEKQFAVDNMSSAIVYKLIGDLCYPDDAWYSSEYYAKAIEIWASQGVETIDLAEICERAAKSFVAIAEFEEAEGYYLKALKLKEKFLGEGHSSLASLYNEIGIFYQYNPEKAIPYYQKALDIWKKEADIDPFDISTSYYNIGAAYVKLHDYSKALEYLNQSLDIRTREYGEMNPYVALVIGQIGGVYFEQEDFAKAFELFSKAYDILKKTVTAKDPCIKQMKKNLDAAKRKVCDNK